MADSIFSANQHWNNRDAGSNSLTVESAVHIGQRSSAARYRTFDVGFGGIWVEELDNQGNADWYTISGYEFYITEEGVYEICPNIMADGDGDRDYHLQINNISLGRIRVQDGRTYAGMQFAVIEASELPCRVWLRGIHGQKYVFNNHLCVKRYGSGAIVSTEDDSLVYNSSASQWENQKISASLGKYDGTFIGWRDNDTTYIESVFYNSQNFLDKQTTFGDTTWLTINPLQYGGNVIAVKETGIYEMVWNFGWRDGDVYQLVLEVRHVDGAVTSSVVQGASHVEDGNSYTFKLMYNCDRVGTNSTYFILRDRNNASVRWSNMCFTISRLGDSV